MLIPGNIGYLAAITATGQLTAVAVITAGCYKSPDYFGLAPPARDINGNCAVHCKVRGQAIAVNGVWLATVGVFRIV